MVILKTLFCFFLVASGMCLRPQHYGDNLQNHQDVSNQCCTLSGGTLCGRIVKSCCDKDGCAKKWYGEVCKGNYFEPTCRTCSDECTSLEHGTVCGVSVSSAKIQCCTLQNCEVSNGGLADKLIDKAINKSAAYVPSILKNDSTKKEDEETKKKESEHHQGFADKLLDKIVGPGSKCKPNTVL